MWSDPRSGASHGTLVSAITPASLGFEQWFTSPCPDGTRAVIAGAASGPCSVRTTGPGFAGGTPAPKLCPYDVKSQLTGL